MDDRRKRLDEAIQRRDRLREDVQRVTGRLEAARKELESVEAECREKGLEPEALDGAIERLEERYDSAVTDLETRINQAEVTLSPFVGEDR